MTFYLFFSFIKVGKPTNHKISTKPQQFRRPFTGAIRQGGFCADSMDAMEGDTVGISPCHGQGRNQVIKKLELVVLPLGGRVHPSFLRGQFSISRKSGGGVKVF